LYYNKISLETTGEKYNVTDVSLTPQNISEINDLILNLNNTDIYEISTKISVNDDLESPKIQELTNTLISEDKRISIKTTFNGFIKQIVITRATSEELSIANDILGPITGQTNEITIRLYNPSPKDIEFIKNNYNVTNIREIN